jgi:predicted DNA-binding protein (UPF0278 family)
MRAKKVNEGIYNDPTEGSPMDVSNVDFIEDEFGNIIYTFRDGYRTGAIRVDIWDIANYFDVSEYDMENSPNAITDEMIREYIDELDLNDIEWGEDEGPDPDEMRDWRQDR